MQSRQPGRRTDQHAKAIAIAPSKDEPLGDWAIVTLLGGTYLAGLGTFLGVVYALNQLF
jgi:hypothetical protein